MITCVVNPSRKIHAWLRGQGIYIRSKNLLTQIRGIRGLSSIEQEQTLFNSVKFILRIFISLALEGTLKFRGKQNFMY